MALILISAFVLIGQASFVLAALPSQCDSNNRNCSSDYGSALQTQCTNRYGAANCGTVQDYLSAMSLECSSTNPPGINCSNIPASGIYGNDAAAYAGYAGDSNNTNAGGGYFGDSGPSSDEGGWSLSSISGFGLPEGSLWEIITGIMEWLLGALGILGVIGFLIAGILYLTSTGDEAMLERAKNAMKWSIVGVIVGLLGVVIIQAIDWMLRGSSNF